MFKLLGSIVVIMASGLIGLEKYAGMYERQRMLNLICEGAERIRDNLNCMCMPLYDCFLCGGEFFSKVASYMTEGETPSDSVIKAADREKSLSKDDRETLYRFAGGLLSENCEGQIRNVDILIEEIKHNTADATLQLKSRGKLFIKGSVLIAAAVVLLFI